KHDLVVLEDAAQGYFASYKGRHLGSIGDLGAISFHETKNVMAGEGGALLVNNSKFLQQAEIIREKGTDRSRFFRGEVDKYSWQSLGSSYLPSELTAAFLWAQFEEGNTITQNRLQAWQRYYDLLFDLAALGLVRLPKVPANCQHNGHLFYLLLNEDFEREKVLLSLKKEGIYATFHYVPLHKSKAGQKYCRTHGSLHHTEELAARLIRLPLWRGITLNEQEKVVDALRKALLK
ncbi:MAG: DegT/DnrJ/EryC1/StrS family aminotransferase, partial [Desulfovibrio sp.]|nr:DegT/DnrJ/EryC1/StrS family aminotransferase [Desulfovibrio sp.]